MIAKTHSQAGFSLIEMAVMLIVIGLFAVAAGALYTYQASYMQARENVEIMQTVQNSLQLYMERNGRLPCPASRTAAPDTARFGVEINGNCADPGANANPGATAPPETVRVAGTGGRNVRIGALPVRALGLPDSYMVDAWDNRIVYAVTEDMATAGFAWGTQQGAINLNDRNGNSVTATPGTAVFALLSPGRDVRGSFNLEGVQRAPCGAGLANANCDDADATFVTTTTRTYNIDDNNAFTYSMNYMVNPLSTASGGIVTSSYNWFQGGFGSCSAVCGAGTQYQVVECRDMYGTAVADGYCASLGPKPSDHAVCNTTCSWNYGNYGDCSATCGDGVRTRSVTCLSSSGSSIADAYCEVVVGAKPAGSESCNNDSGCNYQWVSGDWSECTDTCEGAQTRDVHCERVSDHARVDDSNCSGSRPSRSQSCGDPSSKDCCVGADCAKCIAGP